MRKYFLMAGLLSVMATAAAADWNFRASGTTAGVWERNEDGTSLAINCEGNAAGRLRMDLTVATTEDAADGFDIAEFVVGDVSVEMPVEVYGIEGQRLQILRIDVDYNADEIVALRQALQRGNLLSLPAQQGFEAVSFPLRGSGRAIARLEEECPAFWGYSQQNG